MARRHGESDALYEKRWNSLLEAPALKPVYGECRRCSLAGGCKNPLIAGRASKDSFRKGGILFIGRNPGMEEDAQNQVFVGPSGILLNEILMGSLPPSTPYYITNAVKCATPGNKIPSVNSIRACMPYLKWEISVLKPSIIVVLGATALSLFSKDVKISKAHGTVVTTYTGIPVFAMYHPSFILRSYEMFISSFIDAFNTLAQLWRNVSGGKNQWEVNVTYKTLGRMDSLDHLFKELISASEKEGNGPYPVVIDLETTGLNPYKDKLRCIGICTPCLKCPVVIPYENFDSTEKGSTERFIRALTSDERIGICGHNLKFEHKWLKVKFNAPIENPMFDTQIGIYLHDHRAPQSLSALSRYTTIWGYDWEMKEWLSEFEGGDGYTTADNELLWKYNAGDVLATFQLMMKMRGGEHDELGLTPKQLLLQTMVVKESIVTADMELRGLQLDSEIIPSLQKKFTRAIAILDNRINTLPDIKRFINEYRTSKDKGIDFFNPRSPAQVSALVYDFLKLPEIDGRSTRADILERYGEKHGVINMILDYRRLGSLRSSYIEKLPKMADDKGRIHSQFNLLNTVSGRTSSSKPNLQNIPKTSAVKRMFISRHGDDGLLIAADFSQMELMLLASESGEERMLEVFRKGGDIHADAATFLFDVPLAAVTPAMRFKAKTFNFSLIYGITPYGLSHRLNIPVYEAERMICRHRREHSNLDRYMKRLRDRAHEVGYAESPLGRRRYLPNLNSGNRSEVAEAERQAGSLPVQSLAVDITLWAMTVMDRMFQTLKYPAEVVLQVHDAIMVDAKKDMLDKVCVIMRKVMVDGTASKFSFLKIPLKIDITYGPNWRDQKPYSFSDK